MNAGFGGSSGIRDGGGVRKGPRFLKGGTFEGRKAYSCLQFSDVGYIIKFVSLYFAKVNE